MISALRILFLLGFRKIYLVGVDLNMKADARYHFDDGRTHEGVRGNGKTYDRMNDEYMPKIKKEGSRYGLRIYQTNPNSQLKTFDYVPFDSAVLDATLDFGDLGKEETKGMYQPFNEKYKKYQEAHLKNKQQEVKDDVPAGKN
jgi:hypothetical protein